MITSNRLINFSMLPTTDLIDTAKMPLCTYSVRRDSIDGPIVQYATVGETVYHVWQCDSGQLNILKSKRISFINDYLIIK